MKNSTELSTHKITYQIEKFKRRRKIICYSIFVMRADIWNIPAFRNVICIFCLCVIIHNFVDAKNAHFFKKKLYFFFTTNVLIIEKDCNGFFVYSSFVSSYPYAFPQAALLIHLGMHLLDVSPWNTSFWKKKCILKVE